MSGLEGAGRFPLIDRLHLGVMLASLCVAYLMPFELVLLSYAILGPLHYLTEISWLHERSYFVAERRLGWIMIACTVGVMLVSGSFLNMARVLILAMAFAAAVTLARSLAWRIGIVGVGAAMAVLITPLRPLTVSLVVLLPTVVHVSLFTLLFMLGGALKYRSRSQFLLALAYVLCVVALWVWPAQAAIRLPSVAGFGQRYFGGIGFVLGRIFGSQAWPFDARLGGFLSFIYTYHYLNWFIKVRVIKWNEVPRRRLVTVVTIAVASTALYFYNFGIGYRVLFALSLLHVLLELPLNITNIRQLGEVLIPRRLAVPEGLFAPLVGRRRP